MLNLSKKSKMYVIFIKLLILKVVMFFKWDSLFLMMFKYLNMFFLIVLIVLYKKEMMIVDVFCMVFWILSGFLVFLKFCSNRNYVLILFGFLLKVLVLFMVIIVKLYVSFFMLLFDEKSNKFMNIFNCMYMSGGIFVGMFLFWDFGF